MESMPTNATLGNLTLISETRDGFEDSRRLTLADKKMMLTKALEIDPGVEVSWRGIQNLLILLTVAFCLSLYVSP